MTVAVETGTWQLDSTASTVALRHKTMWGLVTVKGAFAAVAGNGEVRSDGSAVGTITLDAPLVPADRLAGDKTGVLQAGDLVGEPGLGAAQELGDPRHAQGLTGVRGEQAQHQELVVRDVQPVLDHAAQLLLDGSRRGQHQHPGVQLDGQQAAAGGGGAVGVVGHEFECICCSNLEYRLAWCRPNLDYTSPADPCDAPDAQE